MKEMNGDIFRIAQEKKADALVVTINGQIKKNGELVMGAGIAKAAAEKWPHLPLIAAHLVQKKGLRVLTTIVHTETAKRKSHSLVVVLFPTKPILGTDVMPRYRTLETDLDGNYPGWACFSDLSLIETSLVQLDAITRRRQWKTVVMTRPGCGNGGRDWENEVKPLIDKYSKGRFIVVTKD